jgi:hypothetical protein
MPLDMNDWVFDHLSGSSTVHCAQAWTLTALRNTPAKKTQHVSLLLLL